MAAEVCHTPGRSVAFATLLDSCVAMNVHLVVPELFPDPERGDTQLSETRVDALETLFARGRRRSGAGASLEAWLLDTFSVARQSDWPAAPYSLVADGGQPNGAWWLRADPVNLSADRDTVRVSDTTFSDLAPEETTSLAAILNAHFATAGISIHPLRPDRWYARVEGEPAMTVPPLADIRGQSMLEHMPGGPDGARWRSVLNEIQMLLHEHPVNLAREARGAPPVNGLWLWGAGRVAGTPHAVYQRVVADLPVAKGLALAAGKRHAPLPASAREWLGGAGRTGVEALVLEALRAPAACGDMAAWRAGLETLERQWFAPLLAALRAGGIGMITLYAPGAARTHETETSRQDLRYFWRRRRRLAAYAAHSS